MTPPLLLSEFYPRGGWQGKQWFAGERDSTREQNSGVITPSGLSAPEVIAADIAADLAAALEQFITIVKDLKLGRNPHHRARRGEGRRESFPQDGKIRKILSIVWKTTKHFFHCVEKPRAAISRAGGRGAAFPGRFKMALAEWRGIP
jgi:hypothetical protein